MDSFTNDIHKRIATTCVTASALRNQGAAGIIEIARDYFSQSISLFELFQGLPDKNKFTDFLNYHTRELLFKFPIGGKSWGAARKGLNLFFRDLVYNKFVAEYFKLPQEFIEYNKAIQNLEVPLDSYVASGIIVDSGKPTLKWKSIVNLDQETNDLFQSEALIIAQKRGVARVHLDLYYWRRREENL